MQKRFSHLCADAEFQGLWPMRTPKERDEVCGVFNLDIAIVQSYVQFGEVFNLLHAAASYLRIHQKGFGAVGVSNKYGDRSYARYPIFVSQIFQAEETLTNCLQSGD